MTKRLAKASHEPVEDAQLISNKPENTTEIPCKAREPLTITNGNELLFHGNGVESITIKFRGD